MVNPESNQHKLKNKTSVIIRVALPEDALKILKYTEQVSAESDMISFGPGEFELNGSEEADFLNHCLGSPNQLYIIAEINNDIVASLVFTSSRRPRLRHSGEFSMTVAREFWGLGIGSLMIDTLLTWASQNQITKKINLRVRTDNYPALRLYKKKGFTREGTISREMFLNGVYYDHHWMGLKI